MLSKVSLHGKPALAFAGAAIIMFLIAWSQNSATDLQRAAGLAARPAQLVAHVVQSQEPRPSSVGLVPAAGLKDEPQHSPMELAAGACKLVTDAEGNIEGQCDLNRASSADRQSLQSPFGTAPWMSGVSEVGRR